MKTYIQPIVETTTLQASHALCDISYSPRVDGGIIIGGDESGDASGAY